jgi:hypothetical protein
LQIKNLAAAAALGALACATTVASAATITPYALPGATTTSLWSVNDHGVLVGTYDGGGFIDDHGTITTVNLPGSPGYVAGISNDGLAVGSDGTTSFFYKAGVLTPFTIAGQDETLLRGISANGRYAAGVAYTDAGGSEGFVLDLSNNSLSTFAPPAGFNFNAVQGVNDAGVAVGSLNGSGGAIVFDSTLGTMSALPALDGLHWVRARTIDDAGDIGGWAFNDDGKWVGFLDTAAGGLTVYDFGSNDTVIYGLNNSGLAVGSYENDDGIDHSFVVNLSAVPEPASGALMAFAMLVGVIGVARRRA